MDLLLGLSFLLALLATLSLAADRVGTDSRPDSHHPSLTWRD